MRSYAIPAIGFISTPTAKKNPNKTLAIDGEIPFIDIKYVG